ENGLMALNKIKEKPFDVVITDIRMPEMTGIELLEKIKEYDSTIQVIVMTSYASIDTAIKAIRLGAYDYLTKPFEDLNVITTVINRTVDKLRLEQEVARLVEALHQQKQNIQLLYQGTTRLFGTLDLKEILQMSTESMASLANGSKLVYYSFSDNPALL